MDLKTLVAASMAGAMVVPGASAALVSVDLLQSTLFASSSVGGGESDISGGSLVPEDWTGMPGFNGSEGDGDFVSPTVQSSAGSTQNNSSMGFLIEGEGQATAFATTDGGSEVDGDSMSMFELEFTVDGPTAFALEFELSTFDVGDSSGEASWVLSEVGGADLATRSVGGNDFLAETFLTVLPEAGQYRLVIWGETDVSGGGSGESAFSSASGGFTFAVQIPSPGAAVMAGLAAVMAVPRRRLRG